MVLIAGCGGSGNNTASASASCTTGQTTSGTLPILGRTSPGTTTSASTSTSTQCSQLMSPGAIPTLVWQEPMTREDGSSLAPNEISQYHIYYRRAGDTQYKMIRLTDPSTTQLSLSGFASGIYDFEITAVDTNGLESPPSQTVRVTVI